MGLLGERYRKALLPSSALGKDSARRRPPSPDVFPSLSHLFPSLARLAGGGRSTLWHPESERWLCAHPAFPDRRPCSVPLATQSRQIRWTIVRGPVTSAGAVGRAGATVAQEARAARGRTGGRQQPVCTRGRRRSDHRPAGAGAASPGQARPPGRGPAAPARRGVADGHDVGGRDRRHRSLRHRSPAVLVVGADPSGSQLRQQGPPRRRHQDGASAVCFVLGEAAQVAKTKPPFAQSV